MRIRSTLRALALCALFAPASGGCDTPSTNVVVDNAYPPSATEPLVIFGAFWQAVRFTAPIVPGASSDPASTVAASPNTAYVVLAPGWDQTTADAVADAGVPAPWRLVVLQSRQGLPVHWNTTLHVAVDDTTFAGRCAAGSALTQDEADFITGRVFADLFAGLHYDAATCTTTGGP